MHLFHEWIAFGPNEVRIEKETEFAYLEAHGNELICVKCGKKKFGSIGRDPGPPIRHWKAKEELWEDHLRKQVADAIIAKLKG